MDQGSIVTSPKRTDYLQKFKQQSRFSRVRAHHHAGVTQRAIQTLIFIAQTMMLYPGIHWPDMADTAPRPMAVSHAVFLNNHVPDITTRLNPEDAFMKIYVFEKRISNRQNLG
jgi:hypothetical protein